MWQKQHIANTDNSLYDIYTIFTRSLPKKVHYCYGDMAIFGFITRDVIYTSLALMLRCEGVDFTGLLGGMKEDWGSVGPTGRGYGGQSPEADAFIETKHNICIKIQQTTVVAVTG